MAEIRYELMSGLHPSFRKDRTRCIRIGTGRHAPEANLGRHCAQRVPPGAGWQKAKVYRVHLSPDLLQRWNRQAEWSYVVALTEKDVADWLKQRFGAIAKRNSGLASHVLSLAMQRISTRAPAAGSIGGRAKRIGDSWVKVETTDTGDSYSVRITDNLSYAVDAVNGGDSGIETALKSAANRVNAMIRNRIGAGKFDESWRTPFPEVKRK